MAKGFFGFSVTLVSLLVIAAALLRTAHARPSWLTPGSHVFTESAECHTHDELLDLCQRCGKLTKLREAYQACCSTDLSARRWCSDFVYFGSSDY